MSPQSINKLVRLQQAWTKRIQWPHGRKETYGGKEMNSIPEQNRNTNFSISSSFSIRSFWLVMLDFISLVDC